MIADNETAHSVQERIRLQAHHRDLVTDFERCQRHVILKVSLPYIPLGRRRRKLCVASLRARTMDLRLVLPRGLMLLRGEQLDDQFVQGRALLELRAVDIRLRDLICHLQPPV